MGFLDGFLGSIFGSSGGESVGGGILGSFNSMFNAGLDSLGLSQHGRDQYFARNLQWDFLNSQQDFQREQTASQQAFTREMYGKQWQDMLEKYPLLAQKLNDQQFNLWKNQFDLQNAWNSPGHQMALQRAGGINPALQGALTASNSMGASSSHQPPIISPTPFNSPASPIGLPQGLSGRGTDIAQIGSFIRDLAQAKKTGKESERYDEITDAMIEKMYKDGLASEALAAYNGAKTVIERALGKDAKYSEILVNLRKAMVLGQQEKTEKALEELHKAEAWLTNSKNEEILERLPFIQDNLRSIIDYFDSGAARNRAEAHLSYAKAVTEKDLRQMYHQQGGLYEELKGLRHVDRVEQYATMPDRITESINLAEQSGLISQQMAEDIRNAQKHNDWYDVNQAVNILYNGLNSYYHGRLVDAKDVQNAISQDWYDYQKEHYGDVDETVEDTGPSGVRGHRVTRRWSRRRPSR